MLFARRLNEDSWFDNSSDKNQDHIDSDSATDLQTKQHELSVWQVTNDKKGIDDIALAIALTRDEVKGFFIALLDPSKLLDTFNWTVPVCEQEGMSALVSLNKEHRNFMVFTIEEIGYLVTQIHNQYLSSTDFVYYSETKLTSLLAKAIDRELIDVQMLKENKKTRWIKAYNSFKESLNV